MHFIKWVHAVYNMQCLCLCPSHPPVGTSLLALSFYTLPCYQAVNPMADSCIRAGQHSPMDSLHATFRMLPYWPCSSTHSQGSCSVALDVKSESQPQRL